MPVARVAICHQSVVSGDAIGRDVAGMYRFLERIGYEPVIVSEVLQENAENFRSLRPGDPALDTLALLIYHHSQFWAAGDDLIAQISCPILFRYHNITPAHFFAPFSALYAGICAKGREQTERFRATAKDHLWLADSEYNKEDLTRSGTDKDRIRVGPPFNLLGKLLLLDRLANYRAETIELLFVGRLAPNKGHIQLLRTVHALRPELRQKVRLRIVGANDPELNEYYEEIVAEISRLALQDQVELRSHYSDLAWVELFQKAHLYLCFSEHEGFCLPIVECQAIGLPVVASGATAVAETAGANQLISAPPESQEDYLFYAALIERVLADAKLRDQVTANGERNVRARFIDEPIENAFAGALYELLRT